MTEYWLAGSISDAPSTYHGGNSEWGSIMQTRAQFLRNGALAVAAGTSLPGVLAACGSDGSGGDSDDPIKVGVLVPLSGALELYGQEGVQGSALAAEQINAKGGLLGRKIKLIREDTESEPGKALQKLKKLALEDEVDFVMGPISSAEREALLPFAMPRKLPILYFQLYEGGACDKYLYCTGPTPETSIKAYMPWLLENHGSSMYFVGWDYNANQIIGENFPKWLDEAGGDYVGQTLVPFSTTDFAPLVRKAQAAGADILFHGMYGSAPFMETVTQFGLKKNMHVSTWAFDRVLLKTLSQRAAANLSWPSDWDDTTPPIDIPENKKFIADVRGRFGGDTPLGIDVYSSYVALNIYAEAIAKAGTLDPDEVADAMGGRQYKGPSGTITILGDNHNAELPARVFTSGDVGDAHTVTMVKDLGTGKPPETCNQEWKNS